MNNQSKPKQEHTEPQVANSYTEMEVTEADLPLHCPMEGTSLWNSHPRVYLPIESSGEEICPYCGTQYTLKKLNA